MVMTPTQVCHAAASTTLQYWHVNPPKHTPKKISRKLIRWHLPDPDYIKLNFDGSVLHNSQVYAGFVLPDYQGNLILASAKIIGHSSIIVVEAMTLREGLRQVIIAGHSRIIVEDDSKILIDNLIGTIQTPSCSRYSLTC